MPETTLHQQFAPGKSRLVCQACGSNRFRGATVAVAGSLGAMAARHLIDCVLRTGFAGTHREWSCDALDSGPLRVCSPHAPAHDYTVLELNARDASDMGRLAAACAPQIAVVPSIADLPAGRDLALTYNEWPASWHATAALVRALPADGVAVLNGDDVRLRRVVHGCRAQSLWIGRGGNCDLAATHMESRLDRLSLRAGGMRLTVPIHGRHHLVPILAAVALGQLFGVPRAEIADALAGFEPAMLSCRRMQIAGAAVLCDSHSASPAGMRAALKLLRDIDTSGKRIVVCGDLKDLGPDSTNWHRRLGEELVTLCGADWLLACGGYAPDWVLGARRAGMPASQTVACDSVDDVAERLSQTVSPGDAVLIQISRDLPLERVVERLESPRMLRVAA